MSTRKQRKRHALEEQDNDEDVILDDDSTSSGARVKRVPVAPVDVSPSSRPKRVVASDDDDDSDARAKRELRTRHVVSVFGPKLLPGERVIKDAQGTFAAGGGQQDPFGPASNPLNSVQVLLQAGGALIDDRTSKLASATTLPIAPSNSSAEGALILYSLYQLVAANTPAATELSAALWIHYRTSLSAYLGVRFPALQNSMRRLDKRFVEFPWGRVIVAVDQSDAATKQKREEIEARLLKKISDSEREKLQEQSKGLTRPTFARGSAEVPTDELSATFADTPKWLDWVKKRAEAASEAVVHPDRTWNDRRQLLLATTQDEHESDTTPLDLVFAKIFEVASAEPVDLAQMAGLSVRHPTTLGERTEFVSPPGVADLVAQVTGTASVARGSSAFERIIESYKLLAAAAAGENKAKLNSAYLYIFLYVWLPLRTGIGFDPHLNVFRPRVISNSLVGHTGLLPLLGCPLYASQSTLGGSPMTFTLARELLSFWDRVLKPAQEPSVAEPDTVRDFLRRAPVAPTLAWAGTRHPSASAFRRAELPLLGYLFRAVVKTWIDGALLTETSPWLLRKLQNVQVTQLPIAVPDAERTVELALSVYQTSAERVGAPSADRVYPTAPPEAKDSDPDEVAAINYAEFGRTSVCHLMDALLTNPTGEPMLAIFVGPALGRLPAMLAYRHQWLWCACVPAGAVSNTPAAGLVPRATDWITPIVREMSMVSGDATLVDRVFVLSEWPLCENYKRGVDIFNAATRRMGTTTPIATFLVGNSFNAAVQFDVPEALFAQQFLELQKGISGTTTVMGQLTTTPTGVAGAPERAIALGAAALPLGPLLEQHGLSNSTIYYAGAAGLGSTGVLAQPAVGADRRRRAMLRTLGPGGASNELFAELRDAVKDAGVMLDAVSVAAAPQASVYFSQQLMRIAVIAVALERLRGDGLVTATPPADIVTSLDALVKRARSTPYVDTNILEAADAQMREARSGMQTTSVLGQLLVSLEGSAKQTLDERPLVRLVDVDDKVKVEAEGALWSAKLALDRLDRARVYSDEEVAKKMEGTRCLDVLGAWSSALFGLATTAIEDYRRSYLVYTPETDSTVALESQQHRLLVEWPRLVACLDALVASGDAAAAEDDASLQNAYGPALIYAQMINSALVAAQRMVEAFQTDLRAERAVAFRDQESPFVAWFGQQAGAAQDTIARVADLLFRDSRWMLPLMVAVTRSETGGFISLNERAAMAARQSVKLLAQPVTWMTYESTLKEQEKTLKEESKRAKGLVGRDQEKLDDEDKQDLERGKAKIREQKLQTERLTNVFASLGNLFRAQQNATTLPLNFFVESRPEFTSDLDALEQLLLPPMREAVRAMEAAAGAKVDSGKLTEDKSYTSVLSDMERLFQELAWTYVVGGYEAVLAALVRRDATRRAVSDVQEQALRTEDVWSLPLNFESSDPELAEVFRDSTQLNAIRDWLALLHTNRLPPRSKVIPGRKDLVLVYEQVARDADDSDADADESKRVTRTYLVVIPNGSNQKPSPDQMAWMKRYLAADRLRLLRLVARDLEILRTHNVMVREYINGRVDLDRGTVTDIRGYYRVLSTNPAIARRTEAGSLNALTIQADDYWLSRALAGDEANDAPSPLPTFVREQLSNGKLESYIESNAFDNKPLLRKFLYTAYSNLMDTKAGSAAFKHWRSLLLTAMPAFEELDGGSWAMDPRHLVNAVRETAMLPDYDVVDKEAPKLLLENSVYQNLLASIAPHESKDILAEVRDDDAKAAFMLFAQAYVDPAQRDTAKGWWDKMLDMRENSGTIYAMDMYMPDDVQIMYSWKERALLDKTPNSDVLIRDSDKEGGSLEPLARFSRLRGYIRASDNEGAAAKEALFKLMDQVLMFANKKARKVGVLPKEGDQIQLPSNFESVRSSREVADELESFVHERVVVASEQRRIWRGGLRRLVDTLQDSGAGKTVAWWIRARASSWSQRLRMIRPSLSTDGSWSVVLSAIARELYYKKTTQLKKGERTEYIPLFEAVANSALITKAKQVEDKWAMYSTRALTQGVARKREAADLLATALEPLGDQSVTLAAAYARTVSNTAQPLSLSRILLTNEEKAKQLLAAERSQQTDDEIIRREDREKKLRGELAKKGVYADLPDTRDEVPTGTPTLELFIGRLEDPVTRFDGFVLDENDIEALTEALTEALPIERANEAALWAQLAAWLSRHIQFVDAERNRSLPRVTARDKTSVRAFVYDVLEAANEPAKVQTLIALRLINDSLLYADLDSLKT